ncbi:Myosin protein [Phytophthora cinnamomi]|uniref:Myosin protein n=1 Tax=Phytophthora cinnamomi TaxID=4785 RepID=UPI003559B8C2|nr:Myosin protein [Phytophthora cinnamomi]
MPIEVKTPEDFSGAIGEKQPATVQFSAPRCGGCKMVTPQGDATDGERVPGRQVPKDVYNREWLDLKTPFALDLDHIVEKQCFPFMFSQMGLRQGDEDLAMATEVLRENVVHELDNLALTRSNTNRIKGSAVWHFLDDSLTGHRSKTFTGYLSDARRDNESLGRDATRQITRCMGRSMKMCQRKLGDEGETPVLEQLSEHLQQMYVDMELHGAR